MTRQSGEAKPSDASRDTSRRCSSSACRDGGQPSGPISVNAQARAHNQTPCERGSVISYVAHRSQRRSADSERDLRQLRTLGQANIRPYALSRSATRHSSVPSIGISLNPGWVRAGPNPVGRARTDVLLDAHALATPAADGLAFSIANARTPSSPLIGDGDVAGLAVAGFDEEAVSRSCPDGCDPVHERRVT
jgi:hypothetical protein